MLHPRPLSANIEEMSAQAHHAADLLVGAYALLRRKGYVEDFTGSAVEAISELVAEARAMLAGVIDAMEEALAHQHEGKRAEQLHREHQAKVTASIVKGSVR